MIRYFHTPQQSTEQAKTLGASYTKNEKPKAVLHTWLAWQKNPGLPYGSAIRARYFDRDSEVAERFVAWFRRVFQIADSA